jgi:type VI protein secretion system component Hcp
MADQAFFFLDMTAAGVQGTSLRTGVLNWLELDNWNFSMHQDADPNVGGGKPKTTSAAGRFGFTIKYAGPGLFKHCSTGNLITTPITFRAFRGGVTNTGAAGVQPTVNYFELVFTGAVVAGRSLSGGEGTKTENVELAFQNIKMSYWPLTPATANTPVTRGVVAGPKTYDMKTNMVS